MQALGTQTEKEQVKTFFRHIGYDTALFSEDDQLAILYTFIYKISNEDVGEPDKVINYNGKSFKRIDDLMDMPLKFLVELVNIDVNSETFEFFYAVTALIYRKDWDKPFNKNEYLENQKFFFDAPFIYSLYSMKLFSELIVNLQENYPVLYKGEQVEENDGRKMYGLLKILSNDDATKMEKAEMMPIWRAFSWMEQTRIEEINKKNHANVN